MGGDLKIQSKVGKGTTVTWIMNFEKGMEQEAILPKKSKQNIFFRWEFKRFKFREFHEKNMVEKKSSGC
jgi:hypothetical protein